jgi:hypothetical protein
MTTAGEGREAVSGVRRTAGIWRGVGCSEGKVTGVTATSRVSGAAMDIMALMDIMAFKQNSPGEPTGSARSMRPVRLPQSSRLEMLALIAKYIADIYCTSGCSV